MDSRVNNLISAINRLRDYSITRKELNDVKVALDEIFGEDAKCVNFVYTINTDKIAFGCIVFPVFTLEATTSFMISGDPIKITEYEIELDSKLFDYDLSNEQIASVMLFNIYHMIKDRNPCEYVREIIDDFFVQSGTNLIIRDSVNYQSILLLGLVDTLSQITSCLNLPDDVQNDAFLDSLDLFNFRDTLDKIYHQIPGCENEVLRQPSISALVWCLRVYSDVEKERIPALKLMEKMKQINASALYDAKFNAIIFALNKIDTDSVVTESVKEIMSKAKSRGRWFANLRYNGLREIENDLYVFYLKAKNEESEYEILYCLKQINARLALLDDYIRENPDDPELERWIGVKSQYIELRDVIAKKKLRAKPYGMFVDYDQLDDYYERYKVANKL